MKPIRLTIKGLNSFKEKQVIDFEKLTERGLFGIFGPTGSGKSTILDAITYALYGKIIRDNTGFVNVTEDSAFVSYEFEVGKGKDRLRYIVERNIKVVKDIGENNIKNVKYKTPQVRLMLKDEAVEEGLRIIEEKVTAVNNEIENIIGLKLDDFTRAVVLPQGKFSEFLKSNPADRRDMLERIFGLERYGRNLIAKIKAESKRVEVKLSDLNGKLSQYEGVTKDAKERLEEEVKKITALENELKEKVEKLNKQYEEYNIVWQLQGELSEALQKNKALENMNLQINDKRVKMKRGKEALLVLPIIKEYNLSIKNCEENERELLTLIKEVDELEKSLKLSEDAYNEAYDKREKELPILLSKESDLKQAVVISKDIKEIKNQLDDSKNKLKALEMDELNKLKEIINLVNRNEKLEESENQLEEIIKGLKIEPEWREQVNNAVNREEEYKRLNKEKNNIFEKKDKLLNVIIDIENNLGKHIEEEDNNIKEIENLKRIIEEHKINCPGNNENLLKEQKIVSILQNEYNTICEMENKKSELQSSITKVEKELNEIELKLNSSKESQNNISESLKNISEEIENYIMKNYAAYLAQTLKEEEPCPVCGSLHHVNLARPSNEDNNLIEGKKQDLKQLESNAAEINKQVEKYNTEYTSKNIQLMHIKDEYNILIEKIQDKSSECLRKELTDKKLEFEELKKYIEEWTQGKEKLELSLENLNKEKSNIEKEKAVCEESLKKDKKSLIDLENEYKEILIKLESVLKQLASLKKELEIDNLKEEQRRIKNCDIEVKDKELGLFKVKKEINDLKVLKNELDEKVSAIKARKAALKQSILEKTESMEKQIKKINKLSENREPNSYLVEIRSTIKEIDEKEKKLKLKLNEDKTTYEETKQRKLSAEEKKNTLNKLYIREKEKLEKVLLENNFKDKEEALKFILDKAIIEALEKEIKEYEDKRLTVENDIKRLNMRLNGRKIDKGEWQKLIKTRDENEQFLREKHDFRINLESEFKNITEKLNIVKEFMEEKLKVEHKKSMLHELEAITKGNRLVEFMAMKKLKYVTQEASKQLKDITNGQFALELDEDGSFIMRDDKNGGFRRYTDSLSGGETFLTSLCLALSLSTQIQLKNAASLEFFFLDEGFGTLDTNLLDTVMMSLEKLHSEKLSVGIISHVEELKNRVPLKLLVTPSSFGEGSKVRIEVS